VASGGNTVTRYSLNSASRRRTNSPQKNGSWTKEDVKSFRSCALTNRDQIIALDQATSRITSPARRLPSSTLSYSPRTCPSFQLWLVSGAGEGKAGVSEKTTANVVRGTLRAFLRDLGCGCIGSFEPARVGAIRADAEAGPLFSEGPRCARAT